MEFLFCALFKVDPNSTVCASPGKEFNQRPQASLALMSLIKMWSHQVLWPLFTDLYF